MKKKKKNKNKNKNKKNKNKNEKNKKKNKLNKKKKCSQHNCRVIKLVQPSSSGKPSAKQCVTF